jgi:hypothetical protein
MLDLVANFVKSLGSMSECIPSPVSVTVTISSLLLSFILALIDIVPSSVNFIALVRRFVITWYRLVLSACTYIGYFVSEKAYF